ncbi:MAG TPA: glycosyltransferase, partial [Bacteroidales bacterium]|nr:glycosyltransferase [Bacteroidales bacterium]
MKESQIKENSDTTSRVISEIKLAIILPVFNNLQYTKKCLETLYQNRDNARLTKEQVKIVITDDGSKDGTSEWLANNYPEVYVLKGNGNLWWSGGVNKGIRFALNE